MDPEPPVQRSVADLLREQLDAARADRAPTETTPLRPAQGRAHQPVPPPETLLASTGRPPPKARTRKVVAMPQPPPPQATEPQQHPEPTEHSEPDFAIPGLLEMLGEPPAAQPLDPPKARRPTLLIGLLAIGVALVAAGAGLWAGRDPGVALSSIITTANRSSVEVVSDAVEISGQFLNTARDTVRIDSVELGAGSTKKIALVFDGGDREGSGPALVLGDDVLVDGGASFTVIASVRIDSSTCAQATPISTTVRFTGSDAKHRIGALVLPSPAHTIAGNRSAAGFCRREPLTTSLQASAHPSTLSRGSPESVHASAGAALASTSIATTEASIVLDDKLYVRGMPTSRTVPGADRLWATLQGVIVHSSAGYEAIDSAGTTLWKHSLPDSPRVDPFGRYLLTAALGGGAGLDITDAVSGRVVASYHQQDGQPVTGVWRQQSVLITVGRGAAANSYRTWDPASREITVVTPSATSIHGFPVDSDLAFAGDPHCIVASNAPPDSIAPCQGSLVARSTDLAHVILSFTGANAVGTDYAVAGSGIARVAQVQLCCGEVAIDAQFVSTGRWLAATSSKGSVTLFACPLSGACETVELGQPVARAILARPYGT